MSDEEQERDRAAASPAGDDWRRRRRLAEVFGEVLPESTSDDRDPEGGRGGEDPGEAWLKSQVPPHHG